MKMKAASHRKYRVVEVAVLVVVVVVIDVECDPIFNSTLCLCVTLVQELLAEWMKVVC